MVYQGWKFFLNYFIGIVRLYFSFSVLCEVQSSWPWFFVGDLFYGLFFAFLSLKSWISVFNVFRLHRDYPFCGCIFIYCNVYLLSCFILETCIFLFWIVFLKYFVYFSPLHFHILSPTLLCSLSLFWTLPLY